MRLGLWPLPLIRKLLPRTATPLSRLQGSTRVCQVPKSGFVNGGAMSDLIFRPQARLNRHSCGFTLIELLITMAVIVVLAAIAFPSFREFQIRMQVTDTTNDLVHDLSLARTEAVKRGGNVLVEASGSGWSDGWVVKFIAPDSSEETIGQHPALDTQYSIQSKSTGGGADNAIAFRPTGNLQDATSFDFNVCRPSSSSEAAQSRRITVSGSGIISSRRDVTGSPAGSC